MPLLYRAAQINTTGNRREAFVDRLVEKDDYSGRWDYCSLPLRLHKHKKRQLQSHQVWNSSFQLGIGLKDGMNRRAARPYRVHTHEPEIHPNRGCARAQPEEHRRGHPARSACGGHRACPAAENPPWPSIPSMPRGNGNTSNRSPPTPGNFSSSFRSRTSMRSKACRPPSRSSSDRPPATREHRRHHDGNLRLPARALRPRRNAPLLDLRPRDRQPVASQIVEAVMNYPAGHQGDDPLAADPRAEGRAQGYVSARFTSRASCGPAWTATFSSCRRRKAARP